MRPHSVAVRETDHLRKARRLRQALSDLRVYDLRLLVERATALFRSISFDDELALPFEIIVQGVAVDRLDLRSLRAWLMSALPVLPAFYHCQSLIDRHVRFGQELERLPDVPQPAGRRSYPYTA